MSVGNSVSLQRSLCKNKMNMAIIQIQSKIQYEISSWGGNFRETMYMCTPFVNMCTKFQLPNAIFRRETYFGGCFIPRGCSERVTAGHPIDNGSIPHHEYVYEISAS